jgi:hypothetical protein
MKRTNCWEENPQPPLNSTALPRVAVAAPILSDGKEIQGSQS